MTVGRIGESQGVNLDLFPLSVKLFGKIKSPQQPGDCYYNSDVSYDTKSGAQDTYKTSNDLLHFSLGRRVVQTHSFGKNGKFLNDVKVSNSPMVVKILSDELFMPFLNNPSLRPE